MKNYHFSLRRFFINNFFDIKDTKIKLTTSCSPRRAGSKIYFFILKGQFQNFTSGQVKVRPRSDHDPSRSICTSPLAVWWAKPFGTICASQSPSCPDLLAKNGLWPHLTSGDLPVTPDRQLHPGHHRCGVWPWSWKNWWFLSVYAKWEAFSYSP